MTTQGSLLLHLRLRTGLVLLVLLTSGLGLSGCATTGSQKSAPPPAENIYSEGRKALQAQDYPLASSHFRQLEIYYPDSPYNHQAQMELAYAYFKSGDYSSSIATTDRLIRNYPDNNNQDYPRYLKALASYEQAVALIEADTDRHAAILAAQTALQYFNELKTNSPDSKYQQDADKRVAYLQEQLAQYEVTLARKMIEQGNHASAIVHARNVVENYPNTRSAADALAIVDMGYEIMAIDNSDDNRTEIQQQSSVPAVISSTMPMVTGQTHTETVEEMDEAGMEANSSGAVQAVQVAKQPRPSGTLPSSWIKQQPADQYTIQLVSTVDSDTLTQFIKRHKLADQVAYYHKKVNGKTWHALVYGVYPSVAEARQAVAALPTALRNNKPWIQGIQTIQQAIDDPANNP